MPAVAAVAGGEQAMAGSQWEVRTHLARRVSGSMAVWTGSGHPGSSRRSFLVVAAAAVGVAVLWSRALVGNHGEVVAVVVVVAAVVVVVVVGVCGVKVQMRLCQLARRGGRWMLGEEKEKEEEEGRRRRRRGGGGKGMGVEEMHNS